MRQPDVTNVIIRPLGPDEVDLPLSMTYEQFEAREPLSVRYTRNAATRQYRPEWTWVVLRDDRVVARAIWWGGPDDTEPNCLDQLDFDDPDDAVALLGAAGFRCEYILQLPPLWRTTPSVGEAVRRRVEAVGRVGFQPFVERLHYVWTTADGLPERPGRLVFREEPDEDRILDVLCQVMEGTLDAHEQRTIARAGIAEAAGDELAFFRWCPSPRDWWQLAYTVDGALVGIAVPARNHTSHIIGFIGVVPEQRGHGYSYDLLVEATQVMAAAGATSIVADTDVTNTPMAATFAKAGYPITQERQYLNPDAGTV